MKLNFIGKNCYYTARPLYHLSLCEILSILKICIDFEQNIFYHWLFEDISTTSVNEFLNVHFCMNYYRYHISLLNFLYLNKVQIRWPTICSINYLISTHTHTKSIYTLLWNWSPEFFHLPKLKLYTYQTATLHSPSTFHFFPNNLSFNFHF